ncbi:NUDIX domain-containing protein [Granulicella arctica]|uniref:NUDIX domain-containing protein n=1 Tax=Granulicella arctica TaxID=940613 RepID=UPI0021E011C5|nr:NUDIX domain-containing protein [Granulicella arctica]
MPKRSAGLLMYRNLHGKLEVFLIHPGGPYFAHKDHGVWAIPKGEYGGDEEPLAAAQREFQEETGFAASSPFHPLETIRQNGGKLVIAWAFRGDCDPTQLVSNTCSIEWPPRSGRRIEIPEVDRGAWFTLADARKHIRKDQEPLLDRLEKILEA